MLSVTAAFYEVSFVELDERYNLKYEVKFNAAHVQLSELLCELKNGVTTSVVEWGGSAAVWQWVLQGAKCCGEGYGVMVCVYKCVCACVLAQ